METKIPSHINLLILIFLSIFTLKLAANLFCLNNDTSILIGDLNINKYLATSDGQIQDSIELQGPYGIVFTSLIFFLLLGIIRMFIGPDNKMEEA